MKVKKIGKLTPEQLKIYQKQKETIRKVKILSGYEKIVLATDQDLDGFHIRGLLIGFILSKAPKLQDHIAFLNTPVLTVTQNGKIKRWCYNIDDDIKLKKGEEPMYMKGLGSWEPEDLKRVIEVEGLDKMIDPIEIDDINIVHDWLKDDSSLRKKYILANDFDIINKL